MAMALAFEGIGGVQGLMDWANTNTHTRTVFYSLYAKTIPMTLLGQIKHTAVDAEEVRAKLADGLMRIIKARRGARAQIPVSPERIKAAASNIHDMAALFDDGALDDGDACEGTPNPEPPAPAPSGGDVITDVTYTRSTAREPPPAEPNVVQINKVKPDAAGRVVGPTVPGLCAGAANEGVDHSKSATELFYKWDGHTGHGRPP